MNTEIVWNQFSERLFNFITSKVGNPDIAKDILQDIFLKIHTKLDQLINADRLESWVFQITRNAINDYFRRQKRESDLLEIPSMEEDVTSPSFLPCLYPFIEKLSPADHSIIIKTLKGATQKSLAAEYNMSYSGVKSKVQRAREKLKNMFKACCNEIDSPCLDDFDESPCNCNH